MSVTAISDLPEKSTPKFSLAPEPRGRGAGRTGVAASYGALGAITVDVFLVYVSGLISYRLYFPQTTFSDLGRMLLDHPWGSGSPYLGFLTLYTVLLILVALSQHLYKSSGLGSVTADAVLVGRSVLMTLFLFTASLYLSGIDRAVPRFTLLMTAGLSLVTLASWRAGRAILIKKRLAKGIGLRHVLIVGAGRVGRLLASSIEQNPGWGYEVRGFLDTYQTDDPRVLGRIGDLRRIVRQEFIDDVFVTIPSERELVKQIVREAHELGICTYVLPELYDGYAWLKPVEFVGDFAVRVMYREPIPEPELFLKRLMDIVGSAIGLLALSPVLSLLALAVKLESEGPVLYRAPRVGRKGRRFICHKFRTMVTNADELKEKLRHLNEREGPFFKIEQDPRITRVGRFLRKYSLDELPQLWDVLRGDMSLVGPRPHPLDDYQQYTLEHLRRLDVTPGITGLWQVMARRDPSFERALALDNQYIETWSFLSDLRILLRTIPSLIKGAGS
jgi:exopolysaccharide biosynthesis polyprenyl glycosylphosphotransferase